MRIILYCSVRVLYDVPEFVLFSERQRRRQRSPNTPECIPGTDDGRRARFRSLSGGITDAENYTEPIEKRPSATATLLQCSRRSGVRFGDIFIFIYNVYLNNTPARVFLVERMRCTTATDILCYYYTVDEWPGRWL